MTVTVKNGKVTRIERSAGPINLFTEAAQENVSSWAFASQIRAKFDVEYIYEIAGPEVDFPVNPHIEMDLPFRVKLTSNPVKARTEY